LKIVKHAIKGYDKNITNGKKYGNMHSGNILTINKTCPHKVKDEILK